MKLYLRMPRAAWPQRYLEDIYRISQSAPELGFLRKEVIRDHIVANDDRGTFWAAYLDDLLVGVSMIGSRSAYPHLLRHGEVCVLKEYRRRRIGTALYFAHILQGYLEGRREAEDTIIPSLSPWMIGRSDCGGDGIGFLPSLGYEHYGTLPRRTGGFLEIQLWGRSMADYRLLGDYESRLPQEFELEIELHDTLAAMATFEKNITVFSNRFKDVALIMTELRGAAMTYPFVSSREERPE